MKRRIVLLGPPASGKGTQAEMIADRYGIPTASPGAMLREERARETQLGIEADKLTAQGKLVPDELICGVVAEWLKAHRDAFTFDGFPRSHGQADALESMLAEQRSSLEVALSLEADHETIASRVQNRLVCTTCRTNVSIGLHVPDVTARCPRCGGVLAHRADDNLETLQNRMQEYEEKSAPLVAYYAGRGILRAVDSTAPPEVVFRSIADILEGE